MNLSHFWLSFIPSTIQTYEKSWTEHFTFDYEISSYLSMTKGINTGEEIFISFRDSPINIFQTTEDRLDYLWEYSWMMELAEIHDNSQTKLNIG